MNTITIGLDIAKSTFHLIVMNAAGKYKKENSFHEKK